MVITPLRLNANKNDRFKKHIDKYANEELLLLNPIDITEPIKPSPASIEYINNQPSPISSCFINKL